MAITQATRLARVGEDATVAGIGMRVIPITRPAPSTGTM
jgi:hypothetical protein